MFRFLSKKSIIIPSLVFFLIQASSASFAGYEVINAKTVKNDNIIEDVQDNYIEIDEELPSYDPDNTLSAKLEKGIKNFSQKRKNKKNKKNKNIDENISNEGVNETTPLYNESSSDIKQAEVVNTKNNFQVNADKITYDDDEGNVYAKGHVEIVSNAQGVVLKADDAVLDRASQTIKLQNNVKIIKNGTEMTGEYLLVDLNEQNILMDNPTIDAYSFQINAQEAYLIANDLQMINGTVHSEKKTEFPVRSTGFMYMENINPYFPLDKNKYSDYQGPDDKKQNYKINAKKITLTTFKDHHRLLLQDSDIYYNKVKIIPKADIEIITDKTTKIGEVNGLEAGNLRNFGTYVGYGFVNKLPKGQTLKLSPTLVLGGGDIGIGLIGRHRSRNGILEAGWNTATTNVVARGRYKIGNGFELRYGRHAYIPDGFLGSNRSGYAAQLQLTRSYTVKDLGINFNNGVYAGIFSDYKREHQEDDVYATTRFRYMAEARKQIFKYSNKEQEMDFIFGALAQGAATVYGSGETTGIARIGPYITTRLKRWESGLGYTISGTHGESPFMFDNYRYGKHTVMLNEKIHINNFLALGYRAYISPQKDNLSGDLLTESRFYAIFGPRDLKLAVSYDFIRDTANLNFLFLLGTESAKIRFDKLITETQETRKEHDFYKRNQKIKIEKPENI